MFALVFLHTVVKRMFCIMPSKLVIYADSQIQNVLCCLTYVLNLLCLNYYDALNLLFLVGFMCEVKF